PHQRRSAEIVIVKDGLAVLRTGGPLGIAARCNLFGFPGGLAMPEERETIAAQIGEEHSVGSTRNTIGGIGIAVRHSRAGSAVRVHPQRMKRVVTKIDLHVASPAYVYLLSLPRVL